VVVWVFYLGIRAELWVFGIVGVRKAESVESGPISWATPSPCGPGRCVGPSGLGNKRAAGRPKRGCCDAQRGLFKKTKNQAECFAYDETNLPLYFESFTKGETGECFCDVRPCERWHKLLHEFGRALVLFIGRYVWHVTFA
jgi:hypothetical protein